MITPQALLRKSSAHLTLKPFQVEDHLSLRKNNYRGLVANSPGTGKTILVLACIRHDRKRLAPAVIIAPASVVSNWVREAQKWLPGVKVHLISDTSTRLPRNPHDIYVISWALLTHRVRELRRLRPRFIVGDEIHYCKSEETQRSMALRELSTGVPHMILMSGTPIVNNLNELENIKAFFNQPNVLVIRRLLEDVQPDIPPKTRATLPIRLRDEDARQYRKAEEDFADWLENELRKRMSEGEALTSAQRALSAEALVKTGYLRRLLGEAKVPAAVDWIARAVRIGEPVVVFCEHQNVVEMMQRSLNNQHIQYVTIDGSTGREERQNAIDSFQAGRVPVFIGTKAAKEGITLVRARHLLFLERFWTSADEEQAEDRIRRIGQTRPTMIWFLHAVDTIDDRIAEIIAAKRKIVADNLGSSTIEERDEEAVIDLIETWGESTISSFDGQELDLGIGKPPPPMPTPTEVCTLIFRGDKYTVKSAMAWALLHGYLVKRHSPITGGVQLHIHDPSSFAPGKFKTIPISKDVKALVGMRKGHSTRSSPRPSQPKRSR